MNEMNALLKHGNYRNNYFIWITNLFQPRCCVTDPERFGIDPDSWFLNYSSGFGLDLELNQKLLILTVAVLDSDIKKIKDFRVSGNKKPTHGFVHFHGKIGYFLHEEKLQSSLV